MKNGQITSEHFNGAILIKNLREFHSSKLLKIKVQNKLSQRGREIVRSLAAWKISNNLTNFSNTVGIHSSIFISCVYV